MAEHNELPPPFRALFAGPALDEPAPPPPIEPDDDQGDGPNIFPLRFTIPKLIVLSDGSTRTDGWTGSLLVGWFWLASAATAWVVLQAAWGWLGYLGWGGFHAGLVGGAITAGLILGVVVVSGLAVLDWSGASSLCLLAGSALYVLGSLFVTMRCNVPRNEALGAVSGESAEGQRLWSDYLSSWTAWNHVRCVASLAACGLFGAAGNL